MARRRKLTDADLTLARQSYWTFRQATDRYYVVPPYLDFESYLERWLSLPEPPFTDQQILRALTAYQRKHHAIYRPACTAVAKELGVPRSRVEAVYSQLAKELQGPKGRPKNNPPRPKNKPAEIS